MSLAVLAPEVRKADQTGGQVSTGISGATSLVLSLVEDLIEGSGIRVDFRELRLAIIGYLVSAGHHTMHEIMLAAQIWDSERGGKYGLAYVDGWSRYRVLAPLTEAELREHVAQDGLFPDEIAYGVREEPLPKRAFADGMDLLAALRLDPASWAAELERDAGGRTATEVALSRADFPTTRLKAWSENWKMRQHLEQARAAGSDGRVRQGTPVWREYLEVLRQLSEEEQETVEALRSWGHLDPSKLAKRFEEWASDESRRRHEPGSRPRDEREAQSES
jgi:hypothetical protein